MRKLVPLLLILTTLGAQLKAQCDASFSTNINGATVQFFSDTTRPGLLHKWKFGDGTQGFGPVTSHTYNATGIYQVLHIISDSLGQCNDSVLQTVTINIPASCQASFVAAKDSVFPGHYRFFSTSTASGGTIQSHQWTIDGSFVSSSPSFNQSLPQGTHTVCLTISTTAGCSSTFCDSLQVDTVANCDVNADFVATVRQDTVFLQAVDSGVHLFHSWIFGNGSVLFGQNVIRIYNGSGVDSITHYVTDSLSNCTVSVTKAVWIQVPVSCKSSFVMKQDSVVANKYHFFTTSTSSGGSINSYKWTINGNLVSTASGFSRTFTRGTYLTCLAITTTAGCTSTACDNIRVDAGDSCKLNTGFTAKVSRDTVFLAASDATPHLLHHWKLGDGNQAVGRNVIHRYKAPGVYIITHIVLDSTKQCVDSAKQFVTINVPPGCQAAFTVIRDSVHPKKYVFLSNSSAQGGPIQAYRWTLNGHFVSQDPTFSATLKKGVHAVCLTIKTSAGCVSTVCKNVVVDSTRNDSIQHVASYPNPVAGGSVNLQVQLDNQVKVKVTVYNSRGNVVFAQEKIYPAGYNRVTIPVDALQRGQYFVDIQIGNTRKRSVFQKL